MLIWTVIIGKYNWNSERPLLHIKEQRKKMLYKSLIFHLSSDLCNMEEQLKKFKYEDWYKRCDAVFPHAPMGGVPEKNKKEAIGNE